MGVRVHTKNFGLNTTSSRANTPVRPGTRDLVAPAGGSSTGSLDFARDDRRAFRHILNRWFLLHKRDLPWRQSRDPYAILVSEIMLQQTQAAAVVPYYNRWLRRFPTIRSLAATTESDVLHAWQGLGYYTRARNLHRCAKMIVGKFGGRLPNDSNELRSLPGIGLYTANAIAIFAFDQSLPIVEANTARVLSRLFNIRAPIDSTSGRQKLWDASAKLVPKKGPAISKTELWIPAPSFAPPTTPVAKFVRWKTVVAPVIQRRFPENDGLP